VSVPTIASLPAEVIHAIAAGETIDSLAAVVRELAENALDAGATRIAIAVDCDRWQVSVADNGCGMTRQDLHRAAIAHTTSKIGCFDDLHRINSLGFRGEALHSLAQLANLEIHSRSEDGEAWRVTYDRQGRVTTCEPTAIAPGTVVNVRDLFHRWPQRRQALPNPGQQLRAIQRTVFHLALCHPHVAWQVRKGHKRWFALSPGQTPRHTLVQLLRDVRLEDLHYSHSDNLELVVGLPDRCHRRRPDWIAFAVNGRIVRLPELENSLIGAFARTLPRHRYPLAFLHLRAAPEDIDWNRHPAKSEIYLQKIELWQHRLREAVEGALQLSATETGNVPRVRQLLRAAEPSGQYQLDGENAPEDPPAGIMPLRAIGQANNTYILAEHPDGLWLVEQHIAHERVIYEELRDRWQLVELEPPVILQHLAPVAIERLQRLGITVDAFGEGLWAVRQIPEILRDRDDCADALRELSQGDLEAAQVATACRSAIRNGTILTLKEMQQLLDRWQRTRNPHTCPHGRPIYLALNESSLSRYFRRHWVVGKSHGI
jgi:DNA mismatch repair protein MutL